MMVAPIVDLGKLRSSIADMDVKGQDLAEISKNSLKLIERELTQSRALLAQVSIGNGIAQFAEQLLDRSMS